jgi:uncharacterized protein YjiS (DUF1127 family)
MATAALRLVASPLSWLAGLRQIRLVERLVRLDDRLLADMGVSRSEIAALKF